MRVPTDPSTFDPQSPRLRRDLFDFGCVGMGPLDADDRHVLVHDFRSSAARVVEDFERAPIWWVVVVESTGDGSARTAVQRITGGKIAGPPT